MEMNGGDRKVLSGSFAALLLFRILHVELGLKGEEARGIGRPLGHFGTVGFTIGMAGYAAYLGKTLILGLAFMQKLTIGISERILGLLDMSVREFYIINISRKRRRDHLHSCCFFANVDIYLGCSDSMVMYIKNEYNTYLYFYVFALP